MEKVVKDSSSAATNGFQEHQSQHQQEQEQEQEQEEYEQEQEQHQQLRRAQRGLLQRKYDETISICSSYFQSYNQRNHNKHSDHSVLNNVIKLKCQMRRPYVDVDQLLDIHVKCSGEPTEATILDQMVAIALQAIEEKDIQMQMKESSSSILWNTSIDRKRQSTQMWNAMMKSLSIASIGLEAFCVWVQYWQSRGLWKEALRWNVSVLCRQSKNHSFIARIPSLVTRASQ